jgi:adenosine 3'-phospho 5'-phosphosulfate transporter B2
MPERTATDNALEVLSYAISFGSFYLFIWVARKLVETRYHHERTGLWPRLLHACVSEQLDPGEKLKLEEEESDKGKKEKTTESFCYTAMHLGACTVGIIISYVLWGYMQERIMTKPYATGELFHSSKFLVFANRLLALLVAYTAREIQRRNGTDVSHTAPLYQFSFSSVSNILSSVCQYEALKYISFPTQVLSKSCKMVPVMMMGYFVSRKVYPVSEYLIAVLVRACLKLARADS